jgi:hypothetical protein
VRAGERGVVARQPDLGYRRRRILPLLRRR